MSEQNVGKNWLDIITYNINTIFNNVTFYRGTYPLHTIKLGIWISK